MDKRLEVFLFYFVDRRFTDSRLQVHEKQHPELQQIRKHIRESFDDIQCFLMAHPGDSVSTSPSFVGDLGGTLIALVFKLFKISSCSEIKDEFKKNLQTLIPRLLDSNNLLVKSINGQPITCRELLVYFKVYW